MLHIFLLYINQKRLFFLHKMIGKRLCFLGIQFYTLKGLIVTFIIFVQIFDDKKMRMAFVLLLSTLSYRQRFNIKVFL